jgi:hypothetical protein
MYRPARAIKIDRRFQTVPRSKCKPTNLYYRLCSGPNEQSLDGAGVLLAGATRRRSRFQLQFRRWSRISSQYNRRLRAQLL